MGRAKTWVQVTLLRSLGEGSRHGGPLCFLYHSAPEGGDPHLTWAPLVSGFLPEPSRLGRGAIGMVCVLSALRRWGVGLQRSDAQAWIILFSRAVVLKLRHILKSQSGVGAKNLHLQQVFRGCYRSQSRYHPWRRSAPEFYL